MASPGLACRHVYQTTLYSCLNLGLSFRKRRRGKKEPFILYIIIFHRKMVTGHSTPVISLTLFIRQKCAVRRPRLRLKGYSRLECVSVMVT